MKNSNDNDLIEKAKKGDEEAIMELVHKYNNLINSEIRKIEFLCETNEDYEDLYQNAIILLSSNIKKFNQDKGSFGVFYKVILKNYFCTLIRAAKSNNRKANFKTISIDKKTDDGNSEFISCFRDNRIESNPWRLYQHKEMLIEINKILSHYSNEEKNYLLKRIQGYSYEEIAKIYGVDKKKVDNALFKMRNNIKKELINKSKRK